MADKFCLCGCGEALTGNQRKFSSDACRMRYHRKQKSEQKANKSEQICSLFELRETKIKLSVTVVFRVSWREKGDEMLINKPVRMEMSHFLRAFLAQKHTQAQVLAVQVEKKRG